jgi:hypothetical protein
VSKLFQWQGGPSHSFCVYEGYTATVEFVPSDRVYLMQVVLPTEPAATFVIRELHSFNQAIVDAEELILKHEGDQQLSKMVSCVKDMITKVRTCRL